MKNKLLLSIIFISTILVACNTPTKSISKITLAVGGCNQTEACPFMVIEIDSQLNYKHYCLFNCDSPGLYTGKLPEAFWQQLNTHLATEPLQNPKDSFQVNRSDAFIEMQVSRNNKVYNLKGHKNNFSKAVQHSINQIMNLHHQLKLTRGTDPDPDKLNFEVPIPMDNYYTLPIPNKPNPVR